MKSEGHRASTGSALLQRAASCPQAPCPWAANLWIPCVPPEGESKHAAPLPSSPSDPASSHVGNYCWQEKAGRTNGHVGVWGKKGVELGAAGSSQCDYSHARVRLLFGKIAGKTEVWYPHVSVLVQEDIGGLKWKRRWFLRVPKASRGWENFHNHRHLLSLFLSHFIPTHEF